MEPADTSFGAVGSFAVASSWADQAVASSWVNQVAVASFANLVAAASSFAVVVASSSVEADPSWAVRRTFVGRDHPG